MLKKAKSFGQENRIIKVGKHSNTNNKVFVHLMPIRLWLILLQIMQMYNSGLFHFTHSDVKVTNSAIETTK